MNQSQSTDSASHSRLNALLEIDNLSVGFRDGEDDVIVVRDVSFSVSKGETVALVGESGCGKSVTALSLSRLLPSTVFYPAGSISIDGRNVLKMRGNELRDIRGSQIAYIFQDPGTSLNPVLRVGFQIREAIRAHRPQTDTQQEALRLLGIVGIPDPETKISAYPHELSGGQQQRIMVAMALACNPRLLIADEPTTALDVTIQAQILELLSDIQHKMGMAILLITHNLGLVADIAHTTNVMYAGFIVETGGTEEVLTHPAHPYTRGLLDAIPQMETTKRMQGIDGSVPDPRHLPEGCPFAPRCFRAETCCQNNIPKMTDVDDSGIHKTRCFFPII